MQIQQGGFSVRPAEILAAAPEFTSDSENIKAAVANLGDASASCRAMARALTQYADQVAKAKQSGASKIQRILQGSHESWSGSSGGF
ncbi:hypothetical protein [Kitasatospora sp. MAA4]|uniref:hypothetical protein n=1 Tax=Kitasatospora sp. MAA4 TaxID=3035093 RepID=UPI002475B9C2|nr:hypothetical protein [Kitasatospora sp. MAA4]